MSIDLYNNNMYYDLKSISIKSINATRRFSWLLKMNLISKYPENGMCKFPFKNIFVCI